MFVDRRRVVLARSLDGIAMRCPLDSIGALLIDGRRSLVMDNASLWGDVARESLPAWCCVSSTHASLLRAVAVAECYGIPAILVDWAQAEKPMMWWVEEHRRLGYGTRLAPLLESTIRDLPRGIAAGVLSVVAGAQPPESPKQLAAAAGVTRRSLDRWFARVGIRSGWLLLACARVLRSYADVSDGVDSLAVLARRHGFGTRAALRRQYRAVVGVDPACDELSPPDLQRIAQLLRRGAAGMGGPD